MNTRPALDKALTPPKMISALASGFNTVANNIYLILMPVFLDFFLLFGPKISLSKVLGPYMDEAIKNLLSVSSAEMVDMVEMTRDMWNAFINGYNFLGLLRTFPVGIPSLLSGQLITGTPTGNSNIYSLINWTDLLSTGFLLLMTGILIGTIFFSEVERTIGAKVRPFSLQVVGRQVLQSYILTACLLLILLFFLVPSSFIVSLVTLVSPFLAQIIFLLTILIMIWVFIPLFFSPHGIFASQQSAILSMRNSYRLVRSFLPGTGLFLVYILLIGQGLNMIWLIPPSTSWFILVGIIGHAFISTSLLAASFKYYLAGLDWMKTILEQKSSTQKANMQSLSN